MSDKNLCNELLYWDPSDSAHHTHCVLEKGHKGPHQDRDKNSMPNDLPKPEMPEMWELEKTWKADNDRLCLTGDAQPYMIYGAGWQACKDKFLAKCEECRNSTYPSAIVPMKGYTSNCRTPFRERRG